MIYFVQASKGSPIKIGFAPSAPAAPSAAAPIEPAKESAA